MQTFMKLDFFLFMEEMGGLVGFLDLFDVAGIIFIYFVLIVAFCFLLSSVWLVFEVVFLKGKTGGGSGSGGNGKNKFNDSSGAGGSSSGGDGDGDSEESNNSNVQRGGEDGDDVTSSTVDSGVVDSSGGTAAEQVSEAGGGSDVGNSLGRDSGNGGGVGGSCNSGSWWGRSEE